jgi:hypothetical protein
MPLPLFVLTILINCLLNGEITEARCLIKSKLTGLCQECASDYYFPDLLNSSSVNGPPQFLSTKCLKRINSPEIYSKIIYVANQPCITVQAIRYCNYTDLGEALLKEALVAQSYGSGILKFLLISSYHQISSTFLPFLGVELFKRNNNFNITIETLSPEECSLKGLPDCPIRSKIYLRTQSFSFFTSGELLIKNVQFDGIDLNLLQECRQSVNTPCCDDTKIALDVTKSPCGLRNRRVYSKPAESFSAIPALFTLLTSDDFDKDFIPATVPVLKLENVQFSNIYLLKNETGWQTLIKNSELPSQVYITDVTFRNNYLPLGILKQMNFDEDPYFKLYPTEISLSLVSIKYRNLSNKTKLNSQLSLSKLSITQHHSVLFTETSTSASFRYPNLTLIEKKAMLFISISSLSLSDSLLPTSKKYLLLRISSKALDIAGYVSLDSFAIKNCSAIGIINSANIRLDVKNLTLLS